MSWTRMALFRGNTGLPSYQTSLGGGYTTELERVTFRFIFIEPRFAEIRMAERIVRCFPYDENIGTQILQLKGLRSTDSSVMTILIR